MKFLIILICLAGAGYYCFFHNPEIGDKITAKLGISRETEQPASPQASEPIESPELKFKENTLGARLTELAKQNKLKIIVKKENSYSAPRPSKLVIKDLQEVVKDNAETLQNARSLEQYNEFGLIPEKIGVATALEYLSSLNAACSILIASARVQAAAGKTTAAVKDLARVTHILNVTLNDTQNLITLLVISSWQQELQVALRITKLPKAVKQKLQKNLPTRQMYATVLPQTLDTEKQVLHDAYQLVKTGKMTERNFCMEAVDIKVLRKLSHDKIDKYWAMGTEQIISKFADGTLSRQTTIDTGSADADLFVKKFMGAVGYGRISESLDGFKGKK